MKMTLAKVDLIFIIKKGLILDINPIFKKSIYSPISNSTNRKYDMSTDLLLFFSPSQSIVRIYEFNTNLLLEAVNMKLEKSS